MFRAQHAGAIRWANECAVRCACRYPCRWYAPQRRRGPWWRTRSTTAAASFVATHAIRGYTEVTWVSALGGSLPNMVRDRSCASKEPKLTLTPSQHLQLHLRVPNVPVSSHIVDLHEVCCNGSDWHCGSAGSLASTTSASPSRTKESNAVHSRIVLRGAMECLRRSANLRSRLQHCACCCYTLWCALKRSTTLAELPPLASFLTIYSFFSAMTNDYWH